MASIKCLPLKLKASRPRSNRRRRQTFHQQINRSPKWSPDPLISMANLIVKSLPFRLEKIKKSKCNNLQGRKAPPSLNRVNLLSI